MIVKEFYTRPFSLFFINLISEHGIHRHTHTRWTHVEVTDFFFSYFFFISHSFIRIIHIHMHRSFASRFCQYRRLVDGCPVNALVLVTQLYVFECLHTNYHIYINFRWALRRCCRIASYSIFPCTAKFSILQNLLVYVCTCEGYKKSSAHLKVFPMRIRK